MKYKFEINDLIALFTMLNVLLIICGVWFAPMFGLVNCGIGLGLNVKNKAHLNTYLIQLSLIILNIYFLM